MDDNQTQWWAPERGESTESGWPVLEAGEPVQPRRQRTSARERKQARRRRQRSILVLVVAVAMVLGAGYVVVSLFKGDDTAASASVSDYPGPGRPSVQVVVNSGDTGAQIGQTLVDAGVVATVKAFTKAYDANPDASKIQPGTYTMLLEMKSSAAVLALLDSANRTTLRVTIPEGLTAADIVQRVSEKTTIPLADLQAAVADPASIGLPAEAGGNVEGWLFPATYDVEPTATAVDVLSQMTAKTVAVLQAKGVAQDQWQAVLTKASLVEREGRLDEDRAKMARVIENRLAIDMPLEMDTAVAYGAGKSAMDLTKDDFANADNAYNVYVHAGLPPTPIASPGEVSIDAVLTPAEGSWLFWVTVNLDTGETLFADTYPEHLANVQQYQDWKAANP